MKVIYHSKNKRKKKMKKQEFIERMEDLKNLFGNKCEYVEIDAVIELASELDEPQKVKVSEEEAKFLETFDFNCESDVTTALFHVSRTGWGYYLKDNNGIDLKDLSEGFGELENRKRLIKAILDGYEVEKEKRYTVKMKNIHSYSSILKLDDITGEYFFGSEVQMCASSSDHTRKELEEAGFGEVFNSPLFEVEEVD
jgi:hypothetical protein